VTVVSVLLTLASVWLQARIHLAHRHPTVAEDTGTDRQETRTFASQ